MEDTVNEEGTADPEPNLYSQYREIHHQSLHVMFKQYIMRVFGKVGFVLATLFFVVPLIVMVTIGILFRLDCPIQEYVPFYLIMSGLITITMLAWLVLTQLNFRYVMQLEYYVKMHKIQWFLLLLLFIWCIIGCYVCFSIAFPEADHCKPVLYYMAFFVVVCQIILFLNLCAFFAFSNCACCKYCCRKQETNTDPEGEPASIILQSAE